MTIVLLDAVQNGDRQGNAKYRFAHQFIEVERTATDVGTTFFAAFRHLHESDRDWNPSPTDFARSAAFLRAYIPSTGDI